MEPQRLQQLQGRPVHLTLVSGDATQELEGQLTLIRDQVVVVLPSPRTLPDQARAEGLITSAEGAVRLEGVAHRLSNRAVRLVLSGGEAGSRRQFIRVEITLPATVSAVSLPPGTGLSGGPWQCRVVDISLGGARVLMPLPVPRAAVLRVMLVGVPSVGELEILAHVRSVEPARDGRFSTGVMWLTTAPEALNPIREMVLSKLDWAGTLEEPPPGGGDLLHLKVRQARELMDQIRDLLRVARRDPRQAYSALQLATQCGILLDEVKAFLTAASPVESEPL